MLRHLWILAFVLIAAPIMAQEDGLNLPADLYILNNRGVVQQYSVGALGVSTITPEDAFVLDFGIAPDAHWIAYRSESSLEIDGISDDAPPIASVVLTEEDVPPFRGQGDSIAWSPIGDAVAYTTLYGAKVYFLNDDSAVQLREGQFISLSWSPDGRYLAGEQQNNVWWVYRRDRNTLLLASAIPASLGLGWSSTGELIFAPESGGLFSMNLDANNAQTLLLDDTWTYGLPLVRPDGTLLVFGRQKNDTEVPAAFGRLLGLAPDAPQVNNLGDVSIQLAGLHWTPDGSFLVAFTEETVALVNPATGATFTLPISGAVTYAWGPLPPPNVEGVVLPTDGFFIADDNNGVAQVWRLPKDGSPAASITSESSDVTSFGIAPDNLSVAYSSADRLLLQRVDGGEPVELATLSSADVIAQPAFNFDGQRIIYVDAGLWEVSPAGGDARQIVEHLPPLELYTPEFAPNINAALMESLGFDGKQWGVIDLNAGTTIMVNSGTQAFWLQDGRILNYIRPVTDNPPPETVEIYLNDANAPQTPVELLSLPYVNILDMREIAPGKLRLVWTLPKPGPQILRSADIDVATTVVTPVAEVGFITMPKISPEGSFLAGSNRGVLIFYDFQTRQQTALSQPSQVHGFQWGR